MSTFLVITLTEGAAAVAVLYWKTFMLVPPEPRVAPPEPRVRLRVTSGGL